MFVFDSPALVQITNYYVFSFKRIYLYGSNRPNKAMLIRNCLTRKSIESKFAHARACTTTIKRKQSKSTK